ncbi:hypothetical protein CCACVL1_26347 [Corchorus capsularis]|uniref:Uncharacterized protein n=1 Tax=Corchorus capsularis TaxID=210143 RepID=A0A1R3GF45_COCAP|nr:hypothetical protein CCACVL1_26347 [Corchorus capsularis]
MALRAGSAGSKGSKTLPAGGMVSTES